MHIRPKTTSTKKQDGIVLLEALMAIFLFSIGVLALVGLQSLMAKNVTQSKVRAEASFLANQLIGQMWVDQANLANYAVAAGACSANYAGCSSWVDTVKSILPSGSADVAVAGTTVSVTLSWTLPGEAPSRFQIDAHVTN